MKAFSATRTIGATPATIWTILTDAPSYPDWDPGMVRIEGHIAPEEKLKVFTKLSPDRTFPVTVTEFVPDERMVWASGMPLGLFKGERTFRLTAREDGTTEFSLREEFSGLLLPIIGRSIPDLSDSFEQFADGLKARAESDGQPQSGSRFSPLSSSRVAPPSDPRALNRRATRTI